MDSAITSVSAISIEWVNLMRRCTARSLGAMQMFMRCRTLENYSYSNLLRGNLKDVFEGIDRILTQTTGDRRDRPGGSENC